MAVNKGTSKLKLRVARNINDTSSINQEHTETGATLTSASDIEWQWTSPIGTVSNVKMRSEKRPIGLQQMKQPSKSISPVSNEFPRKRKLIKSEEPVTKLESSEPDSLLSMYNTDSPGLAVGNEYNKPTQCAKENYCALFDDGEMDDGEMDDCLMQCTQYVEDTLSQNPTGITPLEATTPRSTRVHSFLPNSTQSINLSLSFKPSNLSSKPKAAIKPCQRNVPRVETKVSANAHSLLPTFGKDASPVKSCLPPPPLSTSAREASANSKKLTPYGDSTSKYEINDSFDDILMSFCDENVELLSQPSKCVNIPLNVPLQTYNSSSKISVGPTKASESHTLFIKAQDVSIKTKPNLLNSSSSSIISITKDSESHMSIQPQGISIKRSNHLLEPENGELNMDDDFLQPDVLKLLETVEANNSQSRPVSPTQHTCTPQEIENKRREAKMKLERKKLAAKSLSLTNLTKKMGNRIV